MTTPEQSEPEQPHPTGLDRIAAIFSGKRADRAGALATARSEINEIAELAATKHVDRTAALAAAQVAINEAAEREAAALKKQLAALEQVRTDKLEAAAQAVEQARRARAAALVAELNAVAPDSLESLVHDFRLNPTRASAIAIRAVWDRFNARAEAELGAGLSTQILGAVFVDDILTAQPELRGAINRLIDHQFDCGERAAVALHKATQPNASPQTVLDELVCFEGLILHVANNLRNQAPLPNYTALHALRRVHATHGDYIAAWNELGQQQSARREAEIWRDYKPPPPYSPLRSRFLSAGLQPPDE